MHLTQIQIHKQAAARKQLSDSYAWHLALWEAFPGRPDDDRDFLFRIDDRHPEFRVLLLSSHEPTCQPWGRWESKPVRDGFLSCQHYAFQLKANPTMRRCEDRRRLGIYAEDRLTEWMQRKAEHNGFAVNKESLVVGAPIDEVFIRDGRRGKHVSVDFKGYLTVTNREAFRTAFERGIGSAKAFGFGLLMLQPIHR